MNSLVFVKLDTISLVMNSAYRVNLSISLLSAQKVKV